MHYTKQHLSHSVFLPIDLPAPEVASVEDSTVTAGDSHTLQCTMTEIPHLAVQPTVELTGPGGSVATVMGLMLTHTVDPVRTSDAGQYTCRASVDIPSVDISGQSSSTLTVQSKSMEMIDCMRNNYIFLLPTQSPSLVWRSLPVTLLPCMLVLASLSPVL